MKKWLLVLFLVGTYAHATPVHSRTDYEAVAASQTDQVMGPNGKKGDILMRVIVTVTAAATGTVSIKDGSGSSIPITAANTPIGVYDVEIQARSTDGAWQITTGAGATAVGVGRFR